MSGGGGGGGVATFKSIAERRDPNGCGLSVAQTHGPPETKKIDSISFFYQMENFLLFFFIFLWMPSASEGRVQIWAGQGRLPTGSGSQPEHVIKPRLPPHRIQFGETVPRDS